MQSLNWKRIIGTGLGIFALFFGTVGLTGCQTGGEAPTEEQEAPTEPEEAPTEPEG
ncbi:hypothetical protein H1P_1000014 [Hyella patelloides LEGE 07179]|uniref:Uncharacterized protein n=1 Tax=Hyella patelloides LEGE 07179 TaxID=945734 RepID=A0A563VIX3_9CYAN|nr:hypothetical protein [Hyella patelloides]VEP11343.1 hypothetical protein H1P_1000014 [Hyella patelloides LEGE 07179]